MGKLRSLQAFAIVLQKHVLMVGVGKGVVRLVV